jgi:hypothetical protein
MEPQLPGVTPLLRSLETGIWVVRDARGDVHVQVCIKNSY